MPHWKNFEFTHKTVTESTFAKPRFSTTEIKFVFARGKFEQIRWRKREKDDFSWILRQRLSTILYFRIIRYKNVHDQYILDAKWINSRNSPREKLKEIKEISDSIVWCGVCGVCVCANALPNQMFVLYRANTSISLSWWIAERNTHNDEQI